MTSSISSGGSKIPQTDHERQIELQGYVNRAVERITEVQRKAAADMALLLRRIESEEQSQKATKRSLFTELIEATSERIAICDLLLNELLPAMKPPAIVVCPHDGREIPEMEYEDHERWHRSILDASAP